jgi:hypothetical protein
MSPEASRGFASNELSWQALPTSIDDPSPALECLPGGFSPGHEGCGPVSVWSDVCAKAASLQNRTSATQFYYYALFLKLEFGFNRPSMRQFRQRASASNGYYAEPLLRGSRGCTEIFLSTAFMRSAAGFGFQIDS